VPYRNALVLALEERHRRDVYGYGGPAISNLTTSGCPAERVKVVDVQEYDGENLVAAFCAFGALELGMAVVISMFYSLGLYGINMWIFIGPAVFWGFVWLGVLGFMVKLDSQMMLVVRTERFQVTMERGYRWGLFGVLYEVEAVSSYNDNYKL